MHTKPGQTHTLWGSSNKKGRLRRLVAGKVWVVLAGTQTGACHVAPSMPSMGAEEKRMSETGADGGDGKLAA